MTPAEADRLAIATAERDRARAIAVSLEQRLARVGDAIACPHGPRHYYALDATCQRCEMPSWVEAELRIALGADE